MKKFINLSLLLFAIHLFLVGVSAQSKQKAELVVQVGHSNYVGALAFSPDNRFIVSGDGFANVLILWEVASGRELRRFMGHDGAILGVAFSHDGQYIASVSKDKTLRKWEITTGREIFKMDLSGSGDKINDDPGAFLAFTGEDRAIVGCIETDVSKLEVNQKQSIYRPASFSDSAKIVFNFCSMQIWDAANGKLLRRENSIEPLTVSPNGKFALVRQRKSVKDLPVGSEYLIWDLNTNRTVRLLSDETIGLKHVALRFPAFSPDGATLSAIGTDSNLNETIPAKQIVVWDVLTGTMQTKFAASLPNGALREKSLLLPKTNASATNFNLFYGCEILEDDKPKMNFFDVCSLDAKTGKKIEIPIQRFLGYNNVFLSVVSSADGKLIAVGTGDGTTTVINSIDNKVVSWLTGKMPYVADVKIGADDASILIENEDKTSIRWDLAAGKPVLLQKGNGKGLGIFEKKIDAVSPNGKLRLQRAESHIALQRAETGEEILTFENADFPNSAAFSPDNLFAAIGYVSGVVRLWSVVTGEVVKTFVGHQAIVYGVAFMGDGKTLVTGSMDSTTRLWNAETGKEKARLITAFDNSWTVVTPEGLFDASPEARKSMHYVVGLEAVTLEQMKDVYYVPGLLSKIFKDEPLPQVESFTAADLFPLVEFEAPKAGQTNLTVKLTNRGGGIGQVQILVNGKEFIKDARAVKFNANAKETTLNIDLTGAPLINGAENKIEVIARNASGSLTNRGTSRGVGIIKFGKAAAAETPNIYAIVGGISNYTGNNLKLNFAAKDATDFAGALEIGAAKMLGDKSKVHIRLLTSDGDKSEAKFTVPDAKISTATKANFEQAFADFNTATSNDVFIVYLAGHGVSLNLNQNSAQAGGDTYLYLTQEATTTDKFVLSIENSRKAMTVSSEELKDLMKQNKALKQVLILDTCASGQAAASLVAKRDLPSDQIKAIEALKDNTGFYVLMGSAADAVSYETSQYGQGLLTYALLEAMQGAKLREDNKAFVSDLFDHAQKRVPEMAKDFGGIQQPRIITPDESRSFPLGIFTAAERDSIKLSTPKPLILRPVLQNEKLRYDNLKLTALLREELRSIGYVETRGGAGSPIVFIEADEMSNAVTPSGSYITDGENLTITVVLVRNNEQIGKEIIIAGKASEKETLVKQLAAEMIKAAR